jgi:hypothetical protein
VRECVCVCVCLVLAVVGTHGGANRSTQLDDGKSTALDSKPLAHRCREACWIGVVAPYGILPFPHRYLQNDLKYNHSARCNGETRGRRQDKRHHGTTVRTRVPWYSGIAIPFGIRVRTGGDAPLVREQTHMLSRIVVEIRAADIAVEVEP